MNVQFTAFREDHLFLLLGWLQEPHVRTFWHESEDEKEVREKFLVEYPARQIRAFVIELDSIPIGFIQGYEACKIGGGWWPDAKPGVYGIDLMIGDPRWIGKGLLPSIVDEFIRMLCDLESVTEVIVDPDAKNSRAIRAFEKAGFSKVGEVVTPNGPSMLMRRVVGNASLS